MPARHANAVLNGDRLRQIRIGLGLTITEAAIKSGVNRSYLGQLETGARLTTSPGTLKQICAAYDIPMSDALLGESTPTVATKAEPDDRILFTLQQVAKMTGFSYRRLADDCRADPPRVEHVHRDGKRFMTRQQIDTLIHKSTRRAPRATQPVRDADERDRRRAERFVGSAA